MIQIKLFLFILFYTSLNIGQVNNPVQITDFDFNSKNPVFLQYPLNLPWYFDEAELFFEAVTDSFTSICSMIYNVELDSFYQLNYISSESFRKPTIINRNANGKFVDNFGGTPFKMLLWETNGTGNWDIAFSVDSGNGWTPQEFLFSSLDDELNPNFILNPSYYSQYPEILYQRNNSIFLYTKSDYKKNELLFEESDSLKYSSPTGVFTPFDNKYYVVAEENINGNAPHLVYRYRLFSDTVWSDKEYVMVNNPAMNPRFTNPDFEILLSFEHYTNGQNKNLLIRPENFGIPDAAFNLIEDSTIETSDFSAHTYLIVTTRPEDDYYPYTPYTFRYRRNDSTFIRVGMYNYFDAYSDYYSRVIDPNPDIGPLGINWKGAISYTIWEDSLKNKIDLYGVKRVDPLGIVENQTGTVTKFLLTQNYPNPFNPSTIIRYEIPGQTRNDNALVTVKVYDVLGNEIATLVNEEKPAGSYEVEFDGTGLSSGIYFYQLSVRASSGSARHYVETKKMVLIK